MDTVDLTVDSVTTIEAGATTWTGVGQTEALGNDVGATGLGKTASVGITSSGGEVVVDVVGTQNAGATVTVGPGQTERWNQVGTTGVGAASSEPGATTVTMSWDLAMKESWAISAVALLSAGGSYDPDGTIDHYEWKEGDTVLGTTASITKDFSVDTHTVTLTVTDDDEATDTDTVVVTVESPPDTPPTVSITSPDDGATVSGSITIQVDATDTEDAAGTLAVEVSIDGGATYFDITANWDGTNYYYDWNTTATDVEGNPLYPDGSHTIDARATDSANNTTNAAQITVTVDNVDDPPTVAITSPVNGDTVSGTIEVTADATDDKGVTQVEFFVGDASIGVDKDGSDSWSISWDTTEVGDDIHTVTATATDAIGQTDTDSISVTVNNTMADTMYVGDLDGSTDLKGTSGRWEVFVTVTIHDENHNPVANATVAGAWSGATTGTVSGTTGSDGTVMVSTGNMSGGVSVTFTVTGVDHVTLTYDVGANHDPDPDGDSDGTSITIYK